MVPFTSLLLRILWELSTPSKALTAYLRHHDSEKNLDPVSPSKSQHERCTIRRHSTRRPPSRAELRHRRIPLNTRPYPRRENKTSTSFPPRATNPSYGLQQHRLVGPGSKHALGCLIASTYPALRPTPNGLEKGSYGERSNLAWSSPQMDVHRGTPQCIQHVHLEGNGCLSIPWWLVSRSCSYYSSVSTTVTPASTSLRSPATHLTSSSHGKVVG